MSIDPSTDIRRYTPATEAPTTALQCVQTMIPLSAARGPVLQVRSATSRLVFEPGRNIVIGRDPSADVHNPSPLASRAHLILRCVDGR